MFQRKTRNPRRFAVLGATCLLALATTGRLRAQITSNVTISANYNGQSKTAIPLDFAGLSFEMDDLEATPAIFSGQSTALATLIQTLGVKNIRIGGNTGETATYPSDANAADMNDFCQLVGANLEWLVPAKANYNAATYSAFAGRMITDKNSKGQTFNTYFEIGNEADIGTGALSQSTYDSEFSTYITDMLGTVGSAGQVSGADVAKYYSWSTELATNSHYAPGGDRYANVGIITGHNYIFGSSTSQTSVNTAVAAMLNSNAINKYKTVISEYPSTAQANSHLSRVSETSSFSNGGYPGASNAFAAALFAADYMGYMATDSGGAVSGVNFHNVGGTGNYNAIVPYKPSTSYSVQGEGYGMLAFAGLGGGFPVPVTVSSSPSINLTAYAVAHTTGAERLLIINKTYGSSAATASITLSPGKTGDPFTVASVAFLTAPGDINTRPFATTGMTLGGQSIAADGTFTLNYDLTVNAVNGQFTFSLPAAEAAVVYLHY